MEFGIFDDVGGAGAIAVYFGLFLGSQSYQSGLSGSWALEGPVVCTKQFVVYAQFRIWTVNTRLFQPLTTARMLVCVVVKQIMLFTMLTVPA